MSNIRINDKKLYLSKTIHSVDSIVISNSIKSVTFISSVFVGVPHLNGKHCRIRKYTIYIYIHTYITLCLENMGIIRRAWVFQQFYKIPKLHIRTYCR